MDPLDKLTDHSRNLAKAARRAFIEGHSIKAYEYLGALYDFLDDEVGSKARDKCESAESCKGLSQ